MALLVQLSEYRVLCFDTKQLNTECYSFVKYRQLIVGPVWVCDVLSKRVRNCYLIKGMFPVSTAIDGMWDHMISKLAGESRLRS